MALILRNGGSQSPDRWLREPQNNHNGKRDENKKKKSLITTICYTVIYGLIGMAFIFFFGKNIVLLFATSDTVYQLGKRILHIVFLTFPLMGIFYTIMTLYEVTGHEGKAVFLILTRQVFLIIPLAYLLPFVFPGNTFAVFWAVPTADIMALLIAVVMQHKRRIYENFSD